MQDTKSRHTTEEETRALKQLLHYTQHRLQNQRYKTYNMHERDPTRRIEKKTKDLIKKTAWEPEVKQFLQPAESRPPKL